MANIRTLQRAFAGGEVAPEFFGRSDDQKYQSGLAQCLNFIVQPHGPIKKRDGFALVGSAKNTLDAPVRLIPFVFSESETAVIELGDGYFRFFRNGAQITSGGIPVAVAHDYTASELAGITYVQSADIITLCHKAHPVRELRRYGWTDWRLEDVDFVPSITMAVSGQTITAVATYTGTATYKYRYRVTAVDAAGNESVATAPAECSGNVFVTGAYNTITVGVAVPTASRYLVYKDQGGVFGYVGQMDASRVFVDDNITPDTGKTPPEYYDDLSQAVGQYPAAVTYFEQRRIFGGTALVPQGVWMTKSGTESSMEHNTPTLDDNAIYFKVAGRRIDPIKHIVPLSELVLLTGSTELRVSAVGGGALTPATISVRPQGYVGAGDAQPVMVGNSALYATSVGGHIRELAYNWQANGYVSGDLSMRAPHLFEGHTVVELAYQRAPVPIMWAVSSSGDLLGLTYVPEQQVAAWHQHHLSGFAVESVCVIPESGMDVAYIAARDTESGDRQVMRLQAAAPFDCAVLVADPAGGAIRAGVALASRLVHVLCADGSLLVGETSPSGVVHVSGPVPDGDLWVGVPITAKATTLPVQSGDLPAGGSARTKAVNRVWLRVLGSDRVEIDTGGGHVLFVRQGTGLAWEQSVLLSAGWTEGGQLTISHDKPGDFTVLSLSLEVAVGG